MDLVVRNANLGQAAATTKPSLVNWSRLEALPYTAELEPGLQARIADPLWMLGRQWQFHELTGEDAGTPIDVRIELEQAQLDRFRRGPAGKRPTDGVVDFAPLGVPLEAAVEAEPEPRVGLRLAAEAGAQLLRRLRLAGLEAAVAPFKATFPLDVTGVDARTDARGAQWLALLEGRALDGLLAAKAIAPLTDAAGVVSALPAVPGWRPTAAQRDKALVVLTSWLAEFRGAFVQGSASPSAWLPSRQEYAFALRAKASNGATLQLDASEYTDGRLDWHAFSVTTDPGLGKPAAALSVNVLAPSPKLPTPVRYPGMPADRHWEIEDGKVSFGRTSAGPTELMRMLLVEFALVYGNDWFYVPFELPVGSLCSIRSFKVRDVFGIETDIAKARGSVPAPFRLFELSAGGGAPEPDWFFLAPTLPARLQGDPIEELALFRDEMANMAWGVERRTPSAVTGALDRSLEPLDSLLHQEVEGGTIDAEVVYRLQTDVPDRWIPLVPVAEATGTGGFTHWLERRAMVRTRADGSRTTVQPRGQLLRTDPSKAPDAEPALRLAEEEVPREGAVVRRAYQYTRWLDGSSQLWLGRDKTVGRGEGASGLRFDVLMRQKGSDK
jgi:hypothetical protein